MGGACKSAVTCWLFTSHWLKQTSTLQLTEPAVFMHVHAGLAGAPGPAGQRTPLDIHAAHPDAVLQVVGGALLLGGAQVLRPHRGCVT